jgi:hypothetical protein
VHAELIMGGEQARCVGAGGDLVTADRPGHGWVGNDIEEIAAAVIPSGQVMVSSKPVRAAMTAGMTSA